MIKTKNILIIVFIVLIISIVILFIYNSNKKIHLADKYYNSGEYIKIDHNYLTKIEKENYLLFTYNSYCTFKIPCDKVFKETMDKYKIDIVSMPIEEFKKTKFYKKVEYAPSVIIVKKGKVKAFLDPNSNEDLDKYQKSLEFEKWLDKYIYLEK